MLPSTRVPAALPGHSRTAKIGNLHPPLLLPPLPFVLTAPEILSAPGGCHPASPAMEPEYTPRGAYGLEEAGQIFTNKTQAIFYNWKQLPVQRSECRCPAAPPKRQGRR